MWQFLTVPTDTAMPRERAGEQLAFRVAGLRFLGAVSHGLTHRRYEFEAFAGQLAHPRSALPLGPAQRWASLEQLDELAMSRPQLTIARLLRDEVA